MIKLLLGVVPDIALRQHLLCASIIAQREEGSFAFHHQVFLSQSVLKLCKPQSIASPDWAA